MKKPIAVVCALALAACLENEEEIVVRRDGSIAVRVRAVGAPSDLVDGYPVPFGGPWQPEGQHVEPWVRSVGADTGSPASRERVSGGHFDAAWAKGLERWRASGNTEESYGKRDKVELAASAEFRTVDEWSRRFAVAEDPYATAYLERSAKLEVRRLPERTVYVFERRFHGRRWAHFAIWETRYEQQLDEVIGTSLRANRPLDEEQILAFGQLVRRAFEDGIELYVRDSIGPLYTDGDASLPAAAVDSIVTRGRAEMRGLVTDARFREAYLWLLAASRDDAAPGPSRFDALEAEARDRMRTILEESLAEARVPIESQNAVLARLEWNLTAWDHTTDLDGEKFRLRVRMPGVIVDGNFDSQHDDEARFEFDGSDLRDRDIVLRVVSVVE